MKLEQLKQVITNNLKDSNLKVEDILDLDKALDGVNQTYNDIIKAETERSKEKAVKDVLGEFGFQSKEDIMNIKKQNEELSKSVEEQVSLKDKELEEVRKQLEEKDGFIKRTEHINHLKGLNIKEDKLEKAYKLIESEISEEKDFETATKEFVENTPEWLNGGRQISEEGDEGEGKVTPDDAKSIEDAW